MEDYNLTRASRPIIDFADNLSNWYIRRSRRRFWKSENDDDKEEAYQTLHTVLVALSHLLAPFMPFLADEIFRNLTDEESVHLEDWPEADESLINEKLNQEIELARLIVNLGHAIRGKEKIRVRQPLNKASVGLPKSINPEIILLQKEVILEELNVKDIELLEDAGEMAEFVVIPNAKALGPKYGKDVQKIIQEAKAGNFEIADEKVKIAEFTLEPDEVELAYKGKEGTHVESQDGIVVSLDTQITPELRREGMMREIVRHLQEMRKEAGYEVSDRITILVKTESELQEAVTEHADTIKAETLADELVHEHLEWDAEKDFEIEGIQATLAVRRVA